MSVYDGRCTCVVLEDLADMMMCEIKQVSRLGQVMPPDILSPLWFVGPPSLGPDSLLLLLNVTELHLLRIVVDQSSFSSLRAVIASFIQPTNVEPYSHNDPVPSRSIYFAGADRWPYRRHHVQICKRPYRSWALIVPFYCC